MHARKSFNKKVSQTETERERELEEKLTNLTQEAIKLNWLRSL